MKQATKRDKPHDDCPLCQEEMKLIYYEKVWVCSDCGGVFLPDPPKKAKKQQKE